jgi:GMP synthase-like glutamine amidotransferase
MGRQATVALPVRNVLVLQHIACEPPGVFEDVLRERGAALERVELDEGERLPSPGGHDAIVVMGGPMGVYDTEAFPWLVAEQRFLRDAIDAGTAVFGACLGAQLVAGCLGARVMPAPVPEVGILDVVLTAEGRADAVTGGLPERFPVLQWHSDTFDLPAGATLLASSEAYANQAFRVGIAVYAVQFHVEVTAAMLEEWAAVPAYEAALQRVLGPGAFAELREGFAAAAGLMQAHARALFGAWADAALTGT